MRRYTITLSDEAAAEFEAKALEDRRTPESYIERVLDDWMFGVARWLPPLSSEELKYPIRVKRRAMRQSKRLAVFNRDSGICQACKGQMHLEDRWHVDHVVPVAKDGSDDMSNLQLLCEKCNWEKRDQ